MAYMRWVLVVCVCATMLVLMFFSFPTDSLWLRQALNTGHSFFFLFLSFILFRIIKNQTRLSDYRLIFLLVFLLGFFLGLAIEAMQAFLPREMSLNDVYNDTLGLAAGLGLLAAREMKVLGQNVRVYFFIFFSFVTMLVACWPFLSLSQHYIERNKAFPVMLDFGADWLGSFVRYRQTQLIADAIENDSAVFYRVLFGVGQYPSVSLIEPVADWRGYQQLKFSVMSNNQNNLLLTLRIHDKAHNWEYSDRYNGVLTVRPGINEYIIPLDIIQSAPATRKMMLSEISELVLYLTKNNAPTSLLLGSLYLE